MADDNTLILTIFGFYTILFVLMGLIGGSIQSSSIENPGEPTITGIFSFIGFFFSGISFSLSGIPAWANTMLFLPLGITVAYILGKLIIDLVPG